MSDLVFTPDGRAIFYLEDVHVIVNRKIVDMFIKAQIVGIHNQFVVPFYKYVIRTQKVTF